MTTKRKVAVLALAVTALTASPVLAQVADDAPDASADTPSWLSQRGAHEERGARVEAAQGPSLGRSLLLLVVVGGLGGAALYMRKRRGLGFGNTEASMVPSTIRVLSSTRLTPKAHAVIAHVGGRTILLGVTDSNVRRLAWLDEAPAAVKEPEIQATSDTPRNFEGRPVKPLLHGESLVPARAALVAARFNDVLKARLSAESEVVPAKKPAAPAAAADELAEMTQDVYSSSRSFRQRKTEAGKRAVEVRRELVTSAPAAGAPASYEGQIAGLTARLQGKVA